MINKVKPIVCIVLAIPFLLFVSCNDTGTVAANSKKPQLQLTDSPARVQQVNPWAPVDISPVDISYLPADYTILKMSGSAPDLPVARVIYSRPHRQGRTIFGGLLKYGEPWRLGANEATELELFQTVTIQNKNVQKGRYILYAIPHEDKWIIVFNSNLFSWGLRPDTSKDVMRFDAPINSIPVTLEYFTMAFEKSPNGYDLVMAWENTAARLPIQF